MPELTTNFALKKPLGNERVSRTAYNENLDLIDENVHNLIGAHLADYVRQPGYGTTGGSANTYTLTLNPALSAYAAGVCVAVKIHAANTGSSTININGLGAKTIKDSKGNNLTSGKLVLNSVYTMRYDGTNFILQGEGAIGDATAADLLSGKTAEVTAGSITGTMPNRAGDTACLFSSVSGTTLKLLASDGYRDGTDDNITITDANFVANNLLADLFGMTATGVARQAASGTVTAGSGTFSVTGLAFRPRVIVFSVSTTSSVRGPYAGFAIDQSGWVRQYNVADAHGTGVNYDGEWNNAMILKDSDANRKATFAADGVTVYMTYIPSGRTVYWEAYA